MKSRTRSANVANRGGIDMNEPDYCERCDLYTMQKQESEPEDTCEFWYCPVCDTFEEGKELVKQNDTEV